MFNLLVWLKSCPISDMWHSIVVQSLCSTMKAWPKKLHFGIFLVICAIFSHFHPIENVKMNRIVRCILVRHIHRHSSKKCGDPGIRSLAPRRHFPEICSHFTKTCKLFVGLEPFGAAYPQSPWTLFPYMRICIQF